MEKDNGIPFRLTPTTNGTDARTLIMQRRHVLDACRKLGSAMIEAFPNARDYQLDPGAYRQDVADWRRFQDALAVIASRMDSEEQELYTRYVHAPETPATPAPCTHRQLDPVAGNRWTCLDCGRTMTDAEAFPDKAPAPPTPPTVADLRAKAESGQPISLTGPGGLLDAMNREKAAGKASGARVFGKGGPVVKVRRVVK